MSEQNVNANLPLICVPVSVRWGDMDAFNHVNNSVYSTYLEEARLQWFKTFDGPWASRESAPVIAAMTINFRKPVEWPAELAVELFAGKIGRSSVLLPFRMLDRNDTTIVYAEGDTVLVWTSPKLGTSIPLPDYVLRALGV
jgi:acyl-CoA thioester hydrolase